MASRVYLAGRTWANWKQADFFVPDVYGRQAAACGLVGHSRAPGSCRQE